MLNQIKTEKAVSTTATCISVIAPVYNEAESLDELYKELAEVSSMMEEPIEIVFVNDGSSDQTAEVLDRIAGDDPYVTVIHLRRNFGQTAALMAGIDHCNGSIIVTLDADLQNDPADIPALISELDRGFDVVSGWRKRRQDNGLTRTLPSKCANWLISLISGVKLHDYGCTLKVYRREHIQGVRLYGEMHRFIPIYSKMQGARISEMEVNHRPRRYGKSKYGLNRIFKVILDLLLVKFLASYSSKPMYLFGGFGLLCLLLSVFPIGLSLFFKFMPAESGLHKDFVETPLPVMTAVMILVGCLAILQGLVAEILMRTYFESQEKSTYIVKRIESQL